jgi:hypothetical protein
MINRLSPVYVVQLLENSASGFLLSYYSSGDQWTGNPKDSIFYDQLHVASRVAAAEGAQVRVLCTREEYEEFGIEAKEGPYDSIFK